MPSKKVVKASDIAPSLNDSHALNDQSKENDLVYDTANLCAFDSHAICSADMRKGAVEAEKYLKYVARDNVQLLVNEIFRLPYEVDQLLGPCATLPREISHIPREKPVPEPKPLTKWEKFAKEKGIKKKKKSRMVFDESTEEYKPRFGYKSKGNGDLSDWAIPVKKGTDPFVDPFEKNKLEKKGRILKNQMAQLKNIDASRKKSGKKQDKFNAPVGIPESGQERKHVKMGKGHAGTKRAIADVSVSTASLGKFDVVVAGEGDRSKLRQKRRRYRSNTDAVKDESSRNMSVLASIVGKL